MSDSKKAQIGLPEVRLGIFPAWGGCTRLPRVVGLPAALDLILTGKSLDGRRAKKIGLADEVVPVAIFDDWARRFAREKLGGRKPTSRRGPRPFPQRLLELAPPGRRLIFAKAREGVIKQTGGHYPAPLEALEVIEEGFGKPVAAGLEAEARHIGLVFGGEVQSNLLDIFFLTEEVKKETGVSDPAVRPLAVTRVGVLGAGVMGGGIAQLAADKGLPARMKDIEASALAHGYAAAAAVWREALKKRRLTRREMGRKMGLLSGTLDYSGFRRCEVTIEAVVEKLAVKRAVLKEWEAVVPPTAIFASNTSTLPITEIAAGALEPRRVVGMHFFNPVHRMPLVEVIRGERTSDETVATVFALAKTLGKTPVVVRDAPGFLVNRILAPYLSEAVRLVPEGCRIEDVDAAMTAFGMPVGPLALLDDVGLDVAAKAGEVLQAAFPERMKIGGRGGARRGRAPRAQERQGLLRLRGRDARRARARGLRRRCGLRGGAFALPAEVIESRLVLPDDQRGGVLPRGRDRAGSRPAGSRDDLRHGLPAVPRRPAPLRRLSRRRPRLRAPRRPRRAAGAALRAGRDDPRARQHAPGLLLRFGRSRGTWRSRHEQPTFGRRHDRHRSPRIPVVKSLFAGQIPEDTVFPFPEIDAAEREIVSTFLESFRGFAKDHIDPAEIEREHRIPPEVMKGLAELGAFGMTIPEEYGGYGFSSSAYCRVTEEIGTIDASLGILVGGHQSIGMKGAAPLRHRGAEAALASRSSPRAK